MFEELKAKLNRGMVDIQWEMQRCFDMYRLRTLSLKLTQLAGEIEEICRQEIHDLERGD
jgi:hypothetical protein